MSPDLIITLLTLTGAILLFTSEKLPVDIVALLVAGVLMATKVVTVEEGIAGFSNPAVITVACMFVLSRALEKTGALAAIGRKFSSGSGGATSLCLAVMLCVAPVSAFVNNTAAVAVLLPLVFSAAIARKVPASRLLIPLSFASQFGGVCTLIGTSTNLIVNSISEKSGAGSFGMFEFAPLGLIMCVIGGAYLLIAGKWLLPERRPAQLTQEYQLADFITELRVMTGSSIIGQRLSQTPLSKDYGITVLELRRGAKVILASAGQVVEEDDMLLVSGPADKLMEAKTALTMEIEPEFKLADETLNTTELQLHEAIVPTGSSCIGHTLAEMRLSEKSGVIALAVQRTGHVLRNKIAEIRLRVGDALLLLGESDGIDRIRGDGNLVLLHQVDSPALHRSKAPYALLVMGLVVALAALNVIPMLVGALIGVLALIVFRLLSPEQAYSAVDWRVLVMIAGILPLGIAMQKTGAARGIADFALGFAGHDDPTLVLAAIYLLTAVLTEFMSNTGTAVLIAPIAISTAHTMGLDPRPFLVAVAFAASTSFATPVGYQTNTMVYNAGGYKFSDFLRIGVPLNLLFWGASVYFIPKIWPFALPH